MEFEIKDGKGYIKEYNFNTLEFEGEYLNGKRWNGKQYEYQENFYGGNLPYSMHILSPQITKCNVAAKTTSDGKLSVDIEVKAAE